MERKKKSFWHCWNIFKAFWGDDTTPLKECPDVTRRGPVSGREVGGSLFPETSFWLFRYEDEMVSWGAIKLLLIFFSLKSWSYIFESLDVTKEGNKTERALQCSCENVIGSRCRHHEIKEKLFSRVKAFPPLQCHWQSPAAEAALFFVTYFSNFLCERMLLKRILDSCFVTHIAFSPKAWVFKPFLHSGDSVKLHKFFRRILNIERISREPNVSLDSSSCCLCCRFEGLN